MKNNYETGYKTVPEFIEQISEKYGEKIAFIFEKEDRAEEITYKEFSYIVAKNSKIIRDVFGTNQCIAIVGENSIEWVISYFSILCSGNIVVPLEPDGSIENTVDNLKRCGCSVLMHDISQQLFAHKISEEFSNDLMLKEFIDYNKDKFNIENISLGQIGGKDISAEQVATIIFTSGTTGRSKGVKLSHLNICCDTAYASIACPVEGRTVTVLPFHHMYAITTSIFMSLNFGAEIVICPSAKKAFKFTATYNPTYVFAVPMILDGLCKKIGMEAKFANTTNYQTIKEKILGRKFVFFVSGGAILSKELQEKLEQFDIAVYNGYGITECAPVVSVNRQDGTVLNTTVGPALPNVDVCIMNKDDNGEGEICVKGDIVMSGYLNDPEATKEAFFGEWFRTGDIGKLDEANRICITGRCKNLIILSNGKNISPEEIEEKLQYDPMVQEIVVYAKNDSIIAAIYPVESEEPVNHQVYFEDLIKSYNIKSPLYKKISRVEVVDQPFARTSTGKIKRNNFNA